MTLIDNDPQIFITPSHGDPFCVQTETEAREQVLAQVEELRQQDHNVFSVVTDFEDATSILTYDKFEDPDHVTHMTKRPGDGLNTTRLIHLSTLESELWSPIVVIAWLRKA